MPEPSGTSGDNSRFDDQSEEELTERFSGDETELLEPDVSPSGPEHVALQYSRPDSAFRRFTRWTSYLAAVALGVVTIVCFVDVVGAKFFGFVVPSQFELVANLNVVLVFLAIAYVQMDRGSVSIELLQQHFPNPVKLIIREFGSLLGAGMCFFAAYRGSYYVVDFYRTHKSASGVWHFAMWPFQAVLVFGFFCLGLAFLFTLARDVTDYRRLRGTYAMKSSKGAPPATPETGAPSTRKDA